MTKLKNISWPVVLMTGSLLLLGAFQYFWLRSEYYEQKALLQDQQSHIFHSAIRELEDSLFHHAIWTPLQIDKDSIRLQLPRGSVFYERGPDTARFLRVIRSVDISAEDSQKPPARRSGHHRFVMLGAISKQIAESGDSLFAQSLPELIAERLNRKAGDHEGLMLRLVHWQDNPPDTAGLISRTYFDAATGTHYAAEYPDYQFYLLRRILPQLLFAILLFASISAAFYVISRSLARQKKLAVLRNDLISNISHELKTPISTVSVALEALKSFDADRNGIRRAEYLDIAQSEMGRLAILVDKVLKISSLDEEHVQLKVERFDLDTLIRQILDTLKVRFRNADANVHYQSEVGDFTIDGDKLHITGVVYNLLDNAVKYSKDTPEIEVSLTQQNGALRFAVTDRGVGIPAQYQKRIFDKFFRVPGGDTHDTKGHGLGLSYVAQVVKEHGGQLEVNSEPGAGSIFTVTLPKSHGN